MAKVQEGKATPMLERALSRADEFARKRKSMQARRSERRGKVLQNLTLILYRVRHRFHADEWEQVKREFEKADIEFNY